MLKARKTRRQSNSINAGSTADIAFLLLIFFLVTTTILEDKGIKVKLPPWEDDPVQINLNEKNVLTVKINSQDELLVEGEQMNIDLLKLKAKDFIMNPLKRKDMPNNPKKAIVSLQNDRGTTYTTYLNVYNELQAAYNELWEEAAQREFAQSYEDLSKAQKNSIRAEIPLVISEAEPTDHLTAN